MPLTKIPGGIIADGTIASVDITDSTITNAKMAVNPSNASNLSSGSVPAAQLGLAPETDTSGLSADVALLAFKTQANGNLTRYNLVDQYVDSFEDATGVDAPASSDATRSATGLYYSSFADSVGGTRTSYGAYTVHSFLNTGNTNFIVGSSGTVDVLLVGAGGQGGKFSGGGGGAGGFRTFTSQPVTAQTYVVTVGAGGAGKTDYGQGPSGGDSSFNGNAAAGGSGGLGYHPVQGDYPGNPGGSGGGSGSGSGGPYSGYPGNVPSTSPAQGYPGGNSAGRVSGSYAGGGGGGGASAVGTNGTGSNTQLQQGPAGVGGNGLQNDIRTGSNIYYAGGGGAGTGESQPYGNGIKDGGAGGSGGGGQGTTIAQQNASDYGGNPATANTGGGGGGSCRDYAGSGGSGIVVIRYTTGTLGSVEPTMSLVSTALAAQSVPTKGDIVFTYTNSAGTAVLGTNITAQISADDGSTWTDFGIGASDSQGTSGGHTIVTKNNVTITSTITSPYNMRYRIKTLVQSTSLDTRIHAVSLGWS